MTLYQIRDHDDEEYCLIYTNAPEKQVQEIWDRVFSQDEPEDSTYRDDLETELNNLGYSTERLFTTDIYYKKD